MCISLAACRSLIWSVTVLLVPCSTWKILIWYQSRLIKQKQTSMWSKRNAWGWKDAVEDSFLPRNAAKLSACKSVLIGLTQTHSQPARTPMSPVMKVSYLRLCLWTFWMLFFCLGYYKLPLINPKKLYFTSPSQIKKIFLISSVFLVPIYTHTCIYTVQRP